MEQSMTKRNLTCPLKPIKSRAALTLPLKNVSLTEWNNSGKENVNDEDIKGAIYARIQARGGKAGRSWAKHWGGGQNAGRGRADAVQLGQGAAPRPALGH